MFETESSPSPNKGEVFGIGVDLRRGMAEENETESSQQTHSSSEDITNFLYQKKEQGVSGKDTEATQDAELTRATQEQNLNLTEESLIDILYRSMCMLRLGENISNLSNSSSFHFRDLGFMNDVAEALHYSSNGDGRGEDEYERRLDSVLKSYGFVRSTVQGDGDCLLTALALQIQILLQSDGVSMLTNHLSCIGLSPSTVVWEAVPKLRELMVAEWLANKDDYGLRNLCLNEDDILAYEESGVFGGALGDAVPLALSNVLQLPIVIFTSIENFPVIAIIVFGIHAARTRTL